MNNMQSPDKAKVMLGNLNKNPFTAKIAKAVIVTIATVCSKSNKKKIKNKAQ